MLNLAQSKKGQLYKVAKHLDQEFSGRLIQLGFHEGTVVMLKRKAPFFGDPLLFQVGESQIALTKAEARVVEVVEYQGDLNE